MTDRHVVVVPCFNESARLDLESFSELAREPDVGLLFVDDGSTDATPSMLEAFCAQARNMDVRVVHHEKNLGKAAAVRTGMRIAIEGGACLVGYLDADLSTPVSEMLRIRVELERRQCAVAMGSRVKLLGRDILRRPGRHYLGRIFATGASLALGLGVYDTQCGAKWFRVTPALGAALDRPFRSRWAFDVELLGRLLAQGMTASDFLEVPLRRWHDRGGSKLGPLDMARAAFELLRLGMGRKR